MDDSRGIHSLEIAEQAPILDESRPSASNERHGERLSEDFARYFAIDQDDEIVLDESHAIAEAVKRTLENLIRDVLARDWARLSSQIPTPCDLPTEDINRNNHSPSSEPVRSRRSDGQSPALTSLFVSETLSSSNPSNSPYTRFLYHLGLDLCLEQHLRDRNALSEGQTKVLVERNRVFHRRQTYACKHCSFRTDTIHALHYHYRTPHTLSHSMTSRRTYHCIYCSFQTLRLAVLRRHLARKHGYQLIPEPVPRRFACSFCCYETDDKVNILKHNKRCEIDQTQARVANNLLAPFDRLSGDHRSGYRHRIPSVTKKQPVHSLTNALEMAYGNDVVEPILIESDHDTSSPADSPSSEEEFIVSSDEEVSSSAGDHTASERDSEVAVYCPPVTPLPSSKPVPSQPISIVSTSAHTVSTLPSLSKLLLLTGTTVPTLTLPSLTPTKPPLVSIQPKPSTTTDTYQMCHACQCYVYKNDYVKHMNEKHGQTTSLPSASPATILNNNTNSINTTINRLPPALAVPKPLPQTPSTIFLLSTTSLDSQSINLNMIKCPWCDTNFEHIDIMTGHLMRYHRMTLAAAKVVVAEQMKIQGSSSSQLSLEFKDELERIRNEFTDKFYWKVSQPKVYLHQIDTLSCFICHTMVDDLENHFSTLHQTQLTTMNTNKQCCLCGFKCDSNKVRTLPEHQLRMHAGVCYSSVLKQFIRFEPPPLPTSKSPMAKETARPTPSSSTSHERSLTTFTEKKFGCRKCDTGSRLFTFDELVHHLRTSHELTVRLHRRCMICQQTYPKGNEYNEHCLEHLNEENPSIRLKRQRVT